MIHSIAVLGAGSWGTAVAILLARHGVSTCLWGRTGIDVMQRERCNPRYLPDRTLPESLLLSEDLAYTVSTAKDLVIAVPSHAFELVIKSLQPLIADDARIAWLSKGLHPESFQCLDNIVTQYLGDRSMAVLSGPSFAKEVADNLPTAISLASQSKSFANDLIDCFHKGNFRVYYTEDMIGVQLCGAMKNVLAIAVGVSDGLDLGANARAALITRGLSEMTRLGLAMGATAETFVGLAGVGDLILTCTDNQSRNRRFGLALGQGEATQQAEQSIGQVVEGIYNVEQIHALANQYQLELPICENVYQVIMQKKSPQQAVHDLLAREPLRAVS